MMPAKKDPYTGPAQKTIGLFGLLLFSGRAHSLEQLAQTFQCSKQTVMRMIESIENSGWLTLDAWNDAKRRKWYQAQTPKKLPNVTLDAEALGRLMLCRDMVWHTPARGLPQTPPRARSKAPPSCCPNSTTAPTRSPAASSPSPRV